MVHHKGHKGRRGLTPHETSEAITDRRTSSTHDARGEPSYGMTEERAGAESFALQRATPLRPSRPLWFEKCPDDWWI
jgi:hypothetical protein